MADAGIDLWLDWQTQSQPVIVVAYARATVEMPVRYRIVLKRKGASGVSQIVQGGNATLKPDAASALTRIAVSRSPQDECSVEVSVEEGGRPAASRVFDCPP